MRQFFFKCFKSEVIIIFTLLSPLVGYADQPVARFPEENFEYSCQAELSEQVKDSYVTAFMNFSFDRAMMLDELYFKKPFSESDWTLSDYSKKKGKTLPKNSNGYMSFSFGYESNTKAEDRIFVHGSIDSAKAAYASSRSSASFSKKEQIVLNVSVRTLANDTTVTLNTTCERL